MKKVLGFDSVAISPCEECGAIFALDLEKDIEKININNKDKTFLYCPNCNSLVKKVILFSTTDEDQIMAYKLK